MTRFARLTICALALGLAVAPASATIISYEAFLDGPSEAPPNASPGTGYATLVYDDVAHTMQMHVDFAGLIGTTTAAHTHGPTAVPGVSTAGVMTTTPFFAGFPIGVSSGMYDILMDMTLSSSYNPSFITANGGTTASAEIALANAIAQGRAYLNIHSNAFPGGEIRGFWQLVPEPSALSLLAVAGLLIRRRR